jgi:hypothetical protein
LDQKEAINRQLMNAKTQFDSINAVEEDVMIAISQAGGMPISLTSHGPKAQDVTIIESNML